MSANRVRVVLPVTAVELNDPGRLSELGDRGRTVENVQIERGPASIESEYEGALATPDICARIVEAERDGCDAAVIDCMGDPGLQPARELVEMLVLGPLETSLHVAALLGHRFSVLTISDAAVTELEALTRRYAMEAKLASVRTVDIPVLELEADPERLVAALVEQALAAVREDRAHVIVFGCTGMAGYVERVRVGLAAHGIEDVPVIDPMPTTVRIAQALVELGLTHSKRTYPPPPPKAVPGFDAVPQPQRDDGGGSP